MKQRTLALLLAGVLALSLLGAGALAAEGDLSLPDSSVEQGAETVPQEGSAPEGEPAPAEEPVNSPDQSGASVEARSEAQESDEASTTSVEEYIPDPMGSISFSNLNRRMHEGNLQILTIQENIDMLEEIDYDNLKDTLRESLNAIAKAQWSFVNYSSLIDQMLQKDLMNDYDFRRAYDQMDSAYNALRKQYDAIKDGDMQSDNADVVRQLKNLQNQIIMAGEATYIALAAMEIQGNGLDRQLAALDRQLTELDLRYELGHISSLTLHQAQAGRTALASGLATLRMNLDTYKGQLELLLGADITGKISLGALPKVTQQELDEMDLERDLETAKANSWDLYDAAETIKEEKKTYNEHGGDYRYTYKKDDRNYMQARHNWYAAKYTYDNTVQNFELGLRNLYLKVWDYKQILDAAKTALAVEQENYAVAQLKHSQGTLSQNGLLDAEDKLKESQEKVAGAENDLFSAYNTYRWAVDYGILN